MVLDAFYVEKRNIFTFINDARQRLDLCVDIDNDEQKYVNVKFVTCFVNAWPRTYAIASKDIKQGMELFANYGIDYGTYLHAKKRKERKWLTKILKKHEINDINI